MVEFCPECSNLLRKKRMNEKIFLVCKCGYQIEIQTNNDQIEEEIQKKSAVLDKKLIVVSNDDKISVNLKVTKICPKCNNNEAETWQVQIRSSDEPSTIFFRCTKCKFTWREN
jgi:DNA-directed RNA polymerase subunit M